MCESFSFVSVDISSLYQDNNSNCVNDNIAKVLEVYDEETCLETMKGEAEYFIIIHNGSIISL